MNTESQTKTGKQFKSHVSIVTNPSLHDKGYLRDLAQIKIDALNAGASEEDALKFTIGIQVAAFTIVKSVETALKFEKNIQLVALRAGA